MKALLFMLLLVLSTDAFAGPDLSGQYGGMNGIGGFDAVSPELNFLDPTITDVRGDILGYYDSAAGSNTWNSARPTGYGAVPGYSPVALASGSNIAQSSSWRGLWVDITGYYNIGLRPYDPISGRWLTYDSTWNSKDPNYYSFCGGDPINGFDSNGKCVVNTPPDLYFGVAPVMATYLQTTAYLQDGTTVTTGLPSEPAAIFDPNDVNGYMQNLVTEPTGQYESYVSENSLPANYGQTTVSPVTQADVETAADEQFLQASAVVAGTVATDTEEAAPELLAGSADAEDDMVTVTHFTDPATAQLIEQSGAINAQSFVTLPSEIPAGASASDIESLLEIRPGAGQMSYTFQVPQSSLLLPENGAITSGGALQFRLASPVPVSPGSFVPTP